MFSRNAYIVIVIRRHVIVVFSIHIDRDVLCVAAF